MMGAASSSDNVGDPSSSRGPCPCSHREEVQSDIVRERSKSPKAKTADVVVRYPPSAEIARADAQAEEDPVDDDPKPNKVVSYDSEKSKTQLLMARLCCIKCQRRKKSSKGKGFSVAGIRITMNFAAGWDPEGDGTESCETAMPGANHSIRAGGYCECLRCCCCARQQNRINMNGVIRGE